MLANVSFVAATTTDNAPALTGEQLRMLHQVYGIILAHDKPAGTV